MSPLITVIFPLFNLRGETAAGIESWTTGQTLSRENFRVIVACPDDPVAFPRDEVRALVGNRADIVIGPSGSDGALWNAGAAQATTEWLIFTEGHCLADSGCLAAVDAWLRSRPSAQAGNFAIGHFGDGLLARLADRWFADLQRVWRKEWRRLHRAGFVIRADVFHAACGFESEYSEFSMPMLSARLAERGVVIGDVPGAAVIHKDDEDMAGHHELTALYVRGEALARGRNDAAFFERYFGYNAVWSNQLREHAPVAEAMTRAVTQAMPRALTSRPRSMPGLAGAFARLAARRIVPHAARASFLGGLLKCDEAVVEGLPLSKDLKYRRFVSAHARLVRREYLRWAARRSLPPSPGAAGFGTWPAAMLKPLDVVGAHALESHDGRSFRWTEPVFMLRLGEELQGCEVLIYTGALRGDPLRHVLAVTAGTDPLPADLLTSRDGALVIRVPKERAAGAARGLTVICDPVRSGPGAPRDPRALGLPVFAVERRAV